MSDAYDRNLVESESSTYQRLAASIVGVGILAFAFALAALFDLTAIDATFVGLSLSNLLGVGTTLVGLGVVGLGAVSYVGYVETTPDRSAGLVPAVLFGLLWFCVAGLVVSQTFGFGALVWLPAALLVGAGAAGVAIFPREDIGSTLPAGAFALLVGLVFLTNVIGPDWAWSPTDFSATFTPKIVVPFLTVLAVLVASWAAGKAYDDFGARGRQTGAYMLIALNALGILSVLVILVAFVVSKGIGPLFEGFSVGASGIDWPFVQNGNQLTNDVNGVFPAIVGTFWLVVGSVIMAVPLAVGAAVFLTEYAEEGRFTQVVELATNGLWSTPSIVFGLFGYAFLVPRLGNSTSLLSGIFVLGFMLIPLVLITSREAINAVPDEYRDASAALGVSQWQTIKSVVVPAAMPGVITGVILGVGRIAGETAPILLVMSGSPFPSKRQAPNVLDISFSFTSSFPFVDASLISQEALLNSASALPYQLYAIITAGVGQSEAFGWGTTLVLLLVVLSFYAVGIASRAYFRNKLRS
ncbi:phosphate ABC transporter permease PstA [Halogeometricum limi]|uniref:Phosphate transport system permease protein PstA n=1 Tax=Halogeometricum limi TaxID=555875 RepID=A0A1I6HF28_9EURY|nr:phosphate ABC transporter permease PstA [Halogeometricum limi]SFR52988.1 phosphate transport system permease protein [Halogeometricum limi]